MKWLHHYNYLIQRHITFLPRTPISFITFHIKEFNKMQFEIYLNIMKAN